MGSSWGTPTPETARGQVSLVMLYTTHNTTDNTQQHNRQHTTNNTQPTIHTHTYKYLYSTCTWYPHTCKSMHLPTFTYYIIVYYNYCILLYIVYGVCVHYNYIYYIYLLYIIRYINTHMEHIHESEDPHRVLHTSSVSSSLFPVGSFWLHSLTVAVCKRGVGRGKGEVREGERGR